MAPTGEANKMRARSTRLSAPVRDRAITSSRDTILFHIRQLDYTPRLLPWPPSLPLDDPHYTLRRDRGIPLDIRFLNTVEREVPTGKMIEAIGSTITPHTSIPR